MEVKLNGHAPAVHIVDTQTQRVDCPYCPPGVGYVIVTAEISKQDDGKPQMQIRGFHDPKRCVKCNRYFKLEPIVHVKGVAIPGE